VRCEFGLGSTHAASGGNDFLGTFEPYGQWRTHLASFNDTAEVQDNVSRVGINFRTRGDIQMFAGTEWGVNFVQSSSQFNLSAAGPGEFGEVTTATSSPFLARLGYIGIDFGRRAAWRSASNGPRTTMCRLHDRPVQRLWRTGTSTYVAALMAAPRHRPRRPRRHLSKQAFQDPRRRLQGQFRGADKNGVGGSAQVTVMPGVKVGAAFTHTNWPQSTRDGVQGLDENATTWISAPASTGSTWNWVRVLASDERDMVQVPAGDATRNVAFDADGSELFVRARGGPVTVVGGYTHLARRTGIRCSIRSSNQLHDPRRRMARHPEGQAVYGEQDRSRHDIGNGRRR
jgi:hypothetical protein